MRPLPPVVDVVPPEARPLLRALDARIERGCATSERALETLVSVSQLMALPVPPALREAGPRLLTAIAAVASDDDAEARARAGEALAAELAAALERGRAQLVAEVDATLARARAAERATLAPQVRALLAHAVGDLAASVARERERFLRDATRARALLDERAPLDAAIKAHERARWSARFFPEPRPVVVDPAAPWRPLSEPGGAFEVINEAYYRSRGSGIYEDFQTMVGEDATIARADAADFARRIDAAQRAGREVPEVLAVVETGIGSGKFAQGFLDALAEGAPDLYRRVRYHLCDVSPAMLDQALARDSLGRHRERIVRVVSRGIPDALPGGGKAVFCRFYELFDDLPGADLVHRDRDGRLYRVAARAVVLGEEPLERREAPAVPAREVAAWLARNDTDALSRLTPTSLLRLDWEARLEPMDEAALPAPPDELFFGASDLMLAIPHGGARELRGAIDLLDEKLGYLRLSDYAFVAPSPSPRSLPHVSQLVRRYGGSATVDVHAPLLAKIARDRGLDVQLEPLGAFVSRIAGAPLAPIAPFYARYAAANLLRQVSGDDAILPLEELRAFEPLKSAAETLDAQVAAVAPAERAAARASAWRRLVTEAEARGWLDPGLPLHDAAPESPLLLSLAEELDFVANGVFVRAGTAALAAKREWWGPEDIEHLVGALFAIGWKPEAVARALEGEPDRIPLWTLTASRRG
jgi:hypothetical protein